MSDAGALAPGVFVGAGRGPRRLLVWTVLSSSVMSMIGSAMGGKDGVLGCGEVAGSLEGALVGWDVVEWMGGERATISILIGYSVCTMLLHIATLSLLVVGVVAVPVGHVLGLR